MLNPTDTLGYLQQLFKPGDWIDLQLIHQTEKWVDDHGKEHASVDDNFIPLENITPETLETISKAQDNGWNAYVAMNAFTPGVHSRRTKDLKDVRSVYLDFDENGDKGLLEILFDEGIVPTPHFILQYSPGKYYVIWLVEGFTVEQQEALNSALQKRYGSDPAATDAARVLRLPGTRNLKPQYDPTPVVSIIEQHSGERYTINDFKIDVNVREQKSSTTIESKKLNEIAGLVLANLDEAAVRHGDLAPYGGGYKIVLDECL